MTGAISLLGGVEEVEPPRIVLPLTVEPSKPRLWHDARYLNLWMRDKPFSLDSLNDLPRYVARDSFQTALDDTSGYDQKVAVPFSGSSGVAGTFIGKCPPTSIIRQAFWHLVSFVQLVSHVFSYLQISLDEGEYGTLSTAEERNLTAAKSATFLGGLLLGEIGLFSRFVKIYFEPSEDCSIPCFLDGFFYGGVSSNSRKEMQIHYTYSRDTRERFYPRLDLGLTSILLIRDCSNYSILIRRPGIRSRNIHYGESWKLFCRPFEIGYLERLRLPGIYVVFLSLRIRVSTQTQTD